MDPEYLFLTVQNVAVPLGVFTMIVLLTWLNNRQKQAKAQARVELNKHFLDKFTSGQDLTEFLGKDGSQRFLDEMWSEKRHGTKDRVLGTIMGGVVVTAVGIGLLLVGLFAKSGFMIPAAIVLSIGIGLLVASAISYRLSKTWGLAKEDETGPPSPLQP